MPGTVQGGAVAMQQVQMCIRDSFKPEEVNIKKELVDEFWTK